MNPDPHNPDAVRSFLSLHVPCRYAFLRIIRQAVEDLCARAGMTEMKTATFEMAVDEACANVMEHSYGGERPPREDMIHRDLRIHLMEYADRIVLELYDRGEGFAFDEQGTVDPEHYLENERQRGLGMFIIRKFVDDISYTPGTPRGHCLRMIKHL